MKRNTEIELKLLISKSDLKKMLALDFVSAAIRPDSCRKRRLVSSYYDTPDGAFRNNGIAYRVRSKGDRTYEATVKTTLQNGAGLSERIELNLPLPSTRPVLDGFGELGLSVELSELAPDGVVKLFTVNVQRVTYLLDWEDAVIELAIDHGKITAADVDDKIDEIELEIKEGEVAALWSLAAKLADATPLFVEPRSKFARGLALRGIETERSSAKNKIGAGTALAELQQCAQQCGDELLKLQNIFREKVDDADLKEGRRQLAALRALLAVASGVTGADAPEAERVREIAAAVANVSDARELQLLWQKLYAQGRPYLGRGALTKKLGAVVVAAEENLQALAQRGALTAAVFAANALLYGAKPLDGEQTGADALRACVKSWQQTAADAEPQGRGEAVANICAAARLADGKFFTKAAANVKKLRRQLAKQETLRQWRQILEACCADSTSKLVYRDAGVVLGYLLAKEK